MRYAIGNVTNQWAAYKIMSSTPNQGNEAPKQPNETEVIQKLVVPDTTEATADPDSEERSPSKTDRGIAASELSSDSAQPTEVIADVVTPESSDESTGSEGDRAPGKTDRDVMIPDPKTDEAAT